MGKDPVFPVLACFALVFCDCVSAWFTAVTHESPVIVAVGDAAIFTCHTSKTYELKEVRWFRFQNGNYSIINVFRDGRNQQRCDLPEYVGRTELMKEDFARGRAALKLFNVSVADEGTYHCYLETINYFDFGALSLTVTALGSHPRIDIEGFQDGGIKAVCRSAGWYPEPTLVNKDDDGDVKIRQEENGLYSVEHSRVITENSNRTFACKLRTLFPNQEWETSVYVADGLFRNSTDVTAIVLALALVCSLAAVVILGILYTCRKNEQGDSSVGFDIRPDPPQKHAIHEQRPASLYPSEDLHAMLSSVTITEVKPKEEAPISCESSPVTQALLHLGPDSEGDFSVGFYIRPDPSQKHAIHEQRPASLYPLEDLHAMLPSVTITEVSPKEEAPIGCESSPVTQALLHLGPDSEDASSEGNTEKLHLQVPLESGSSDGSLTGSEDLRTSDTKEQWAGLRKNPVGGKEALSRVSLFGRRSPDSGVGMDSASSFILKKVNLL